MKVLLAKIEAIMDEAEFLEEAFQGGKSRFLFPQSAFANQLGCDEKVSTALQCIAGT